MPYDVAVTAIIVRDDGRMLITRRALNKKRFPGQWTVPGGKLEPKDYDRPKDTAECWYSVIEDALEREVLEEVGISIANAQYLTSMVGDSGFVCLSFMADYLAGEVKLQAEEAIEYAWVDLEEAKKFDLIDGVYEELVMAQEKYNWSNIHPRWRKETSNTSSTAQSA